MSVIVGIDLGTTFSAAAQEKTSLTFEGKRGPGKGAEVVFLAGDEEYRSEEGMTMLARILAVHHGFKCTVLFPLNPADGTIDPNNQTNIAGLETLKSADMLVMQLRFRELPDDRGFLKGAVL